MSNQESRGEILNRLAAQFGKKDNVNNFEEFIIEYQPAHVTQLAVLAMNEYLLQHIANKREDELKHNDTTNI